MNGSNAQAIPPADRLAATERAREHQRAWFRDFRTRAMANGEPYVIAGAVTPHEIFHAMDVPLVTDTWYSSIIAAKRLSPHYFDLMDRLGYHGGLSRYLGLPLMATLDGDPERAPYGGLPTPALMVERLRGDFAQRIATQWAEAFGCPLFLLDAPAQTRLIPNWWELAQHDWETLYEPHRLDFQLAQIEALIGFAEETLGHVLDRERLAADMHRINRAGELVAEARDLIASARPCPVSLPDQLTNVMAATWQRGSPWSVEHLQGYVDEIRTRVESGFGICPHEKTRLLWLNVGLWFDTDFYRAFEQSHGAVFVWSMYSNFLSDGYRKYFTGDPLRALAARSISLNEQLHLPPWMAGWILEQARAFGADGAVMLTPTDDRMAAYGTRACINALEHAGLPVLELEASMVDARGWDRPAMEKKVGAFIEDRVQG